MQRKRSKPKGSRNQRLAVNVVSFAATCAVLFVGVKIADGSFTSDIHKISENLDRKLYDILHNHQGPNFTDIGSINATFQATGYFNPRGMGGLYNITIMFMDAILDRDIYPEGILVVENGNIGIGSLDDWEALLTRFAGLLAIVIILVVVAVFFPLCGLCFCCCRCCGKCGATPEPYDKNQDCCKKFVLGTCLLLMGTLLLFGVVCAFVSNQHTQDGTDNLIADIRISIDDTDTYLNTTGKQLNILLVINFNEFRDDLFDILERSSEIVFDELTEYSNAVSLTKLTNIVNGLTDINRNLTEMTNLTKTLRNHASQLNDGLRKVKYDLLRTLKKCEAVKECQDLSNNYISKLDTSIDFNRIPDVNAETSELENLLNGDIIKTIQEGEGKLNSIRDNINKTVVTSLQQVRKTVSEAGGEIQKSVSNVTSVLNQVTRLIHDNTDRPLADAEKYIKDYSQYRYYAGIAVSCVLLLVTLFIALGLICGICGKKPYEYGDDCCNKGAGSRFLMTAVAVMFISGFFLAVITIVYLLLGLFAQRVVCDSIRHYDTSQVIGFIDEFVNFKTSVGVNLTVRSVLSSCHRNESVYQVFQLENQFNLSAVNNYLDEFDIKKALNELQSKLNLTSVEVEILSDTAQTQLRELATSGLAKIEFDRFTGVLDDNLTSIDLNFLLSQLDVVIDAVTSAAGHLGDMEDIKRELQLSRLHLETYQVRLVVPLTENAQKLISIAKNMEESLTFGTGSFEEAIEELITEVLSAQESLRINGTHLLNDIAGNFTYDIRGQVEGYLNRVVRKVRDEVGRCGPLSNVINATLTSTCDRILLPVNGFWFVLFWSLMLFVITIILSVKLASLYQKVAYTGHHNEASKPGKNKKNKKYEGASHEGGPRHPGGSHLQGTRYEDMAPKHWDEFPNGGPPQYQRAPTEYERPPPYYYPGTGDQ